MTKSTGYTLLEVMIALLIFAILAGITTTALHQALTTREHVTTQANQLNELQLAIILLRRDTQQALDRSILGNETHVFAPFIGQNSYMEFSRQGSTNPNGINRQSTLQRVAYQCTTDGLVRRTWKQLDVPERAQAENKIILPNIKQCQLAYIAHNHQTLSEWRANAVRQDQKKENLPSAIQLSLSLTQWGQMTLLFAIPGGLYAAE